MSYLSQGSWFDAETTSLQEIIEEFGEQFRLLPYVVAKVNFPTQPDPTRAPVYFRAVFERDARSINLGNEEISVSTRNPVVTAMVCDVRGVQQGDRLIHLITGELFEIIDPKPDGLSGITLQLVQLGRAAQ